MAFLTVSILMPSASAIPSYLNSGRAARKVMIAGVVTDRGRPSRPPVGFRTLGFAGAEMVSIPCAVLPYCNGHSVLARQTSKRDIEYRTLDNAFGWIAGFEKAQKLADEFRVEMLHRKLDGFADRYCPVVKQFELNYH